MNIRWPPSDDSSDSHARAGLVNARLMPAKKAPPVLGGCGSALRLGAFARFEALPRLGEQRPHRFVAEAIPRHDQARHRVVQQLIKRRLTIADVHRTCLRHCVSMPQKREISATASMPILASFERMACAQRLLVSTDSFRYRLSRKSAASLPWPPPADRLPPRKKLPPTRERRTSRITSAPPSGSARGFSPAAPNRPPITRLSDS